MRSPHTATREQPLLSATREKALAATKTRHNQKIYNQLISRKKKWETQKGLVLRNPLGPARHHNRVILLTASVGQQFGQSTEKIACFYPVMSEAQLVRVYSWRTLSSWGPK